MTLTISAKQSIIEHFRRHENDTASPEIQVALITYRLKYLSNHFSNNKKDNHSKMGLIKMVEKRRKLLKYLKSTNYDKYKLLIDTLGLRK